MDSYKNQALLKSYKEKIMFDIAKDQSVWERVRTEKTFARHRKEIKELYDNAFEISPRPCSAKEILNNDDHQKYFRSLQQLQSATLMALIYPDNEEYYDSLLDIVWSYCNEYTWAPLGHYNGYYDRTPADYDIGLIDIFAASVAFSLAEIKYLFKDKFPKILIDRITAEIRRRTIEPYITRKYFWEKHNNNWTAVCASAVGGVLMYEDPDEFKKQFQRLQASMECYLASYEEDGMCVEGTAYWGFGFGFFAVYAMLLKVFSNGEHDWFKNSKVKAISQFAQKMHLQQNILAMFSDCNIKEGYWVGLVHMLKSIYGDDIESLPNDQATIVAYSHLAFSIRSIVYYNPDYVSNTLRNCVYSAPVTNYFVKRTDNYGFAFKGGNQCESHNHQDVGSFILARNNKQIFCDLGYIGPGNHPEYHGSKRYDYFNTSSFAHNVPYFDGVGQGCGGAEKARAVYDEKTSSVYMDFTIGYSLKQHSKLKKAERTFMLSDDKIELYDKFTFDGNAKITERFITTIKPRIEGKAVIIDDVRFAIKSDAILNIVEHEYISQLPDEHGNYNQIAYCIDITLKDDNTEFKAAIDFIK